jgi:hypothetical protein
MEETVVEEAGKSFAILYAGTSVGSCAMMLLVLANIVVLVQFMREKSDETASGMAKASWAIGFSAMFFGPCGFFPALVAIILSRVETGRIYRGESELRSATPARWGSINGGVIMFLQFLVGLAGVITFVM